jgi:hypothetical protein
MRVVIEFEFEVRINFGVKHRLQFKFKYECQKFHDNAMIEGLPLTVESRDRGTVGEGELLGLTV